MLVAARRKTAREPDQPSPKYLCGDMTCFAFSSQFDAILIPYNSGNLLSEEQFGRCLNCSFEHLTAGGRLLFQVYVPTERIEDLGTKKLFQFQMMDLEEGGQLIKEVRRGYDHNRYRIVMEETYRLRPEDNTNEDWRYTYELLGHPFTWWIEQCEQAGFRIVDIFGSYSLTPHRPGRDPVLLVVADKGLET
jgi:hypothetical protein